jgi:lysine 2,3-aminomutase
MTLKSLSSFEKAGFLTATPALNAVADTYALSFSKAMQEKQSEAVNRQFVPTESELLTLNDELEDPIGDFAHSPVDGLVHRYKDRVLIKITTLCPVYCRFCFRREQVGPKSEATLNPAQLANIYAYINTHPEIYEVILTGGDPLILSPRRLKAVMQALDKIPHVKIIRIHTRVPIVTPEMITPAMVDALSTSKTLYIGLHSNHADEWGEDQKKACAMLFKAGFALLSQTVLLKNINNNAETLKNLFKIFIENKIHPYYLHHPDKAKGTSHFRVSIAEGQAIMRELRGTLPGYALPTYILDIPGGFGKIPLDPPFIAAHTMLNSYHLLDPHGGKHVYSEH